MVGGGLASLDGRSRAFAEGIDGLELSGSRRRVGDGSLTPDHPDRGVERGTELVGPSLVRFAPLVVLLALTSVTNASPPALMGPTAPPASEPPPIDYTPSYRGETLGVDALAVGLALVGAMANENQNHSIGSTMLVVALGTYLVGAPMVHLLKGRPARAGESLALRVGAPLVLGLIGAVVGGSCGTDRCDEPPAVKAAAIGAVIGVIAAPIIDAVFLAKGDPLPASTHLTATAMRDGGMTFGLAGSF
jgi:hypothetical protein